MAEEGFKKALEIFEKNADPVLDIEMAIQGRKTRIQLRDILCLDNKHSDPDQLMRLADTLPAMLVFYGEALVDAEDSLARRESDLELWIQEKWSDEYADMVQDIANIADSEGKKIPAALKSAPTKDQVRGSIILKNRKEYDEQQETIMKLKRSIGTLNNIVKGLDSRIKLLNGQMMMTGTLANRGITK